MSTPDVLPATASDSDGKTQQAMFYVVSIRKFAILYIATLGMYAFYWFYRNWDCYQQRLENSGESGDNIWPVARAIFSVFFTHALFRKIKAHGHDKPSVEAWTDGRHATQLVVVMIAANVLDRAAFRSIGSPYTDILSLILLLPLLSLFMIVQEMINVSCDDPRGASNGQLTNANYAWITAGAIFWILVLIGLFLPNN